MKVIYKIYIGKDLTDTITYFGSVHSPSVAQDFTPEERRLFTVSREILWESETATDSEVALNEIEFIRQYRSNDPSIGYNRRPKLT